MRLPSAIFFDHDGTLVDSEGVHFSIWRSLLEEHDCELTSRLYAEMMAGIPLRQNAIDAVRHFNMSVSADYLEEEKLARLKAFLAQGALPLMPGAKEVIDQCANLRIPMAIVTGGSGFAARRTLETYGWTDKIRLIIAAEDVVHSKPAPDCYLAAIAKLNVDPTTACAVEDTQPGLQAAVSAGLPCDVVPTGLSSSQDFSVARARYSSLSAWSHAVLSN
ncbi:HAD family phosphatase [Alteromonas sediminis]|uniref:HAD family phosphatase n=1 Tax=Alteromonas sediminis TaxID=2259342 RepID=A0A3N5YLI6_9ALTE|nr:HAD family phosphatase [Alteromonas sediminis]RPJ66011.1 HAD family phosphatase [Alteromonas sediminis]